MIDKIGTDCFGCGSCNAKCPVDAIAFVKNEYGFSYPQIDYDRCIECNLCEKVCPAVIDIKYDGKKESKSYAAYSKDKPLKSSSGGSFASLAKTIILNNGTVYGAIVNDNMQVCHTRVDSIDAISSLCGSKYVQSYISKDCFINIKRDLERNIPVLFSGTPCQVAGLKRFLAKDYEQLFLIDLICHGVPSPGIYQDYISYCSELRHQRIKDFVCRDNREGWNDIFKSTIIYINGIEEYNTPLANLWNRIFFSELIIRESCHNCKFSNMDRMGDITLGDFWGITQVPENIKKKGVSLILCNTDKGSKLLYDSQLIIFESKTCEAEHPNLYHPTRKNPLREEFLDYYREKGFRKAIRKYFGFTAYLDFKIRLYKGLMNFLQR